MNQKSQQNIKIEKGDIKLINDNNRVVKIDDILPPIAVIEKYPQSKEGALLVSNARRNISKVIDGTDDRLLVVIGPCSIHDTESALDYANRLKPLVKKYEDKLIILMRVYFEKPRTTIGWKGLINDPYINNTCEVNDGLRIARKLLVDINNLGIPAACEFLDIITPQYISDLISWGAIGARTTESQLHRELASGNSCCIGFKNATNGSIKVAIEAMISASYPQRFIGITKFGQVAFVQTTGNKDIHIILRGGSNKTNYDKDSVDEACKQLEESGFRPSLMIDFSHANSQKDYKKQRLVLDDVVNQLRNGSFNINGVMIESHIFEGCQSSSDPLNLEYGKSITDACISWEETKVFLETLYDAVKYRNENYENF